MEKVITIVFGLIVGSFLNVVIHRLPIGRSIVFPRSACPKCQKTIPFYDNIPILSFLLLLGRCRYCRTPISWRYPLVEGLTALSFYLGGIYFLNNPVYFGFSILFLCLIIALAFIDLEHMILPDELTIGGAIIFLVYSFFNPLLQPQDAWITAWGSSLAFAALYFFYQKDAKIEGMGFGDVKMMLLLGAFLGIKKLVVATLLASVSGLLIGMFFIIFKTENLQFALPFGTFLGLGSYLSVFWGYEIFNFITSLIHSNP